MYLEPLIAKNEDVSLSILLSRMLKKAIVTVVLGVLQCCLLANSGICSINTLYQVPENQLLDSCWRLYRDYISKLDSTKAFTALDSMHEIGQQRNSGMLKLCSYFFKGKYLHARQIGRNDSIPLMYYREAESYLQYSSVMKAEVLFHQAQYYYSQKQFPLAFEYFLKGNQMATQIGYHTFPNADHLLLQLGNSYYHFGEYEKSIHFLNQSLEAAVFERRNKIEAYNSLGLCFRAMEQYDSSAKYFRLALQEAISTGHNAWVGIVSGNLGEIYYKQNWYDTALQYLITDYHSGLTHKQLKSSVYAAILMAKIYIHKADYKTAEKFLEDSRFIADSLRDAEVYMYLYGSLADLYRKSGNVHAALNFIDSFMYYNEYIVKEKDAAAIEKAKLKIETETHLANIKHLEVEKQTQVYIRNGIAIIAFLLLIIAWQRIRRIRLRQMKDLQIMALKQRKARQELETAQTLLQYYTETLKQKSRMLEQVTTELELLNAVESDGSYESMRSYDEKNNIIEKLQNATILTDEDWIEFRKLFTRVHTTFFIQLQELFPNLTQAEIRYLTLSKLGLSINEKASMLGISPDSVRRTRQRLHKKVGLTEQEIFDKISKKDTLNN